MAIATFPRLPIELIERIVEYTHDEDPSGRLVSARHPIPARISYRWVECNARNYYIYQEPSDSEILHALRLTCKDLYAKTIELFVKEHSKHLQNAIFELSPKGLGTMLWVVSNPSFHNLFETIELRPTKDIYEWHNCNDSQTYPGGEDTSQQEAWFPANYWPPHETGTWGYGWSQTEEQFRADVLEYEQSPEMYHILLAIFLELKEADCLKNLVVTTAFDIVLQALEDSAFGRRIATVAISQENLWNSNLERHWNGVVGKTSFVRAVRVQAPDHDYHALAPVPSPSFISIVDVTRTVDELEIRGCFYFRPFERRSTCYGCQEMWKTCFHRCSYPGLRKLDIHEFFVDGGSLRSFFKQQRDTLTSLTLLHVKLTSGSWTRLLTLFRRKPITYLQVMGLYQKQKEGAKRPGDIRYERDTACSTIVGDDIQHFLNQFIHKPAYIWGGKYQEVVFPRKKKAGFVWDMIEVPWYNHH